MAQPLRDLGEVLREGMAHADEVLAALANGPRSIPELSAELHRPSREVTLWVMALRRYGRVVEVPKDPSDDYYRYRKVEVTR